MFCGVLDSRTGGFWVSNFFSARFPCRPPWLFSRDLLIPSNVSTPCLQINFTTRNIPPALLQPFATNILCMIQPFKCNACHCLSRPVARYNVSDGRTDGKGTPGTANVPRASTLGSLLLQQKGRSCDTTLKELENRGARRWNARCCLACPLYLHQVVEYTSTVVSLGKKKGTLTHDIGDESGGGGKRK